ncbi:MAG: MFS transporter [Asgard group archaeon]|nr:MFS transporter [Asgard group archaeon]
MKLKEMKLGLDENKNEELGTKNAINSLKEITDEFENGMTEKNEESILDEPEEEENEDTSNNSHYKKQNSLIWFTNMSLIIAWNQTYVGQQAIAAFINIKGTLMGLINAFPSLLNLAQGLFGRLSDRFGRKMFLIIGFFLFTIGSTVLAFIATPTILVIMAIIQAIATAMISPVLYAAQGDLFPQKTRATTIGRIAAVSAIINMVISIILTVLFYLTDTGKTIFGHVINLTTLTQTRISFTIAALNAFAAILFVIFLKETMIPDETEKAIKGRYLEVLKDKSFIKYVLISAFWLFFGSFPWGVFNIVMVNVLNMEFWQIILFINILIVFRSFIQFFGGKISDKIRKRKPLIILGSMLAPSMAFFVVFSTLAGQWWLMFIDLAISSVGIGLMNILIVPYILDVAPKDLRGSYTGTYFSISGIISFVAYLLGGYISDVLVNNFDYPKMAIILFLLGGIGQLLGAIGFFFIDESIKINNENGKS